MPCTVGIEQASGEIRRVHGFETNLRQRLPLHHLPVSSLAHREGLLNPETENYGRGKAEIVFFASRDFLDYICLSYVSSHNPLNLEVMRNSRNRILHQRYPSISMAIKCWNNQVLQFAVQIMKLNFSSLCFSNKLFGMRTNRPACYAFDAAFKPPAVQDTEVYHTIMRSFHTTSS